MEKVQEFHADHIATANFHASEAFILKDGEHHLWTREPLFRVLEDSMFTVRAVALNHKILSFGYVLEEKFHVNVNKERLHQAGLPVGSWLKDVKQYLWEGCPDDFSFTATHRTRQLNN